MIFPRRGAVSLAIQKLQRYQCVKEIIHAARVQAEFRPEGLPRHPAFAKRGEHAKLLPALELNQPLAIAYYLKDDLSQFWEQSDKAAASRFLDDWLNDAQRSGIRLLIKFAKTLASRRRSLLAWYDYPISTGPLEAVNNKIKLLNRQAFGYRDREFFQLKLYALHTAKYALLG